ncbi:hypothetical protein CRENBAI_017025 [Crenichthys baileyi]|uniref:SOWAHA-C winged helix-turn-helix domain-containing protein n=1 Tax=Crenichthys baileyi TaxID=28760 RepID=A0AAV9QTA7_9TELE
MATDFTLDSVLVFLQSCGGLVKNTELLLHFKPFLRDHPDEVRNRELFKKFVNSVATVTKIDGVSNVVLRKKFRGYVSGGGSGRDSAEPCPVGASSSPAASLAPPGHTERTSDLPAAGIMVAKNNLVETSSSPQQRENLNSEPVGRPAQVGNEVPELHETPAADQSNKQEQNRLVSVPITGVPAVRHQDYIPDPIRGRQIPPQDPMSEPIRGHIINHQDCTPEPARRQEIPHQDLAHVPIRRVDTPHQENISEPIRGHIINRQDCTPEPARRQEIPHQDLAHVPIRRVDTPHQENISEPIRGHIVNRQDNVSDPVGRWDTPHQGTISEPLKRLIVSRQDHGPEPIRGQHIPHQNPVPDPLRGQKTSQDRIVEPFRGHIINRQDHFPGPVRGQQILYQSPYPPSSRGWDTPHQDPIPRFLRGNIISHVPEHIRGQNISYQDPSRDPLRGWESSPPNPIPQSLRGQQIPQNLEPQRGQQIPYQVPVPQSIRGQKISYQDPTSELLRGQQIPQNPDPLRGPQIPQSPDPLKGNQIPQNLEHLRGRKTSYEDPVSETVRGQNISNQDHIPESLRGPQIPQNLESPRGPQIPQNLEHLRGRKTSYEDPVSETVRGQNISNQDHIPESLRGPQIPQNLESPRGPQIPQNLEHLRGRKTSYEDPVSETVRGQNISNQDPIPESLRGQQMPHQDPDPEPFRGHEAPHQDAPPQLHQIPASRFRQRQSYKSAVSQDEDKDVEQVPIKQGSAGGQWHLNTPLNVMGRARGQNVSHHDPIPEPLRGQQIPQQGPDPEPLRGHEPPHQDAPLPVHQIPARRFRQRQSYKSAVSQDEDEDVEQVPIKRGSAGGLWPLNAPLSDMGRAISASSPCITDSTSPTSSFSGKKVPQINIQDSDVKVLASQAPLEFRPVLEPGSVREESLRRSLPSEAQHCVQVPQSEHHLDKRPAQALGPGPDQSQRLSSSRSTVFNPPSDVRFFINDRPLSGSSRTSGWDSSTRADEPVAALESREVLQESKRTKMEPAAPRSFMKTPLHQSMGNLYDDQQPLGQLSPLYRSSDHLHDDDKFTSRGMPMHMSTDDLYDDGKSSDGSIYSPHVQHHPSAAQRMSSRLRSRVCRSLGTDLDQEDPGRGIQAARLERLHRISSSLSLPHNLSSSSLSSCATPPRSPSPVAGMEGEGRKEVRRSHQCLNAGQSPVPLEAREHAWMVKGAAGAWPDIYSLFREDTSLLNRQDFITGFTVLHWIAKHGDSRVLNTLWYGVQKSGRSFNVNAKSTGGQTPLHIAAIHGHKNIIQLLVKRFRADVKLRDTAGKKPWQYLSDRSPEILQLLGAPPRAALTEEVGRAEPGWKPPKPRQGLRHHFSSASSAQRPLTVAQIVKVSRSSSVAQFFKQRSQHRF